MCMLVNVLMLLVMLGGEDKGAGLAAVAVLNEARVKLALCACWSTFSRC